MGATIDMIPDQINAFIQNIEQQLPPTGFLRIHKQHIINLRHVLSVTADGQVTLRNGESLAAGLSYRPRMMELINKRTLLR
ncbi:MAG: LytTR family transcriptional regulator [Cytophagaceae bacterium]|nr:MAG: LytTR family transcriptional regulator [Cytophagaceae bacterium]